jgi:hypothetical protein
MGAPRLLLSAFVLLRDGIVIRRHARRRSTVETLARQPTLSRLYPRGGVDDAAPVFRYLAIDQIATERFHAPCGLVSANDAAVADARFGKRSTCPPEQNRVSCKPQFKLSARHFASRAELSNRTSLRPGAFPIESQHTDPPPAPQTAARGTGLNALAAICGDVTAPGPGDEGERGRSDRQSGLRPYPSYLPYVVSNAGVGC